MQQENTYTKVDLVRKESTQDELVRKRSIHCFELEIVKYWDKNHILESNCIGCSYF